MTSDIAERTYKIKNSEKCFRFKPDAFASHAPSHLGIYELVTFDEHQTPQVLFVGAAFDRGMRECLEAHAAGTLAPTAEELLSKYPNLYFDYIAEWNAKTRDDAQDVYWWLVDKHHPPYNGAVQPSQRPGSVRVIEEE